MNFQKIPKIEEYQFYLDLAFKKANNNEKAVGRADTFYAIIKERFELIITEFPSFDQLSEFEIELIRLFIDIDQVRMALGKLQSAINKLNQINKKYQPQLYKDNRARPDLSVKFLRRTLKEYYGRASSVVKQVKKELLFLENTRKQLREIPNVKNTFTVCIAGFPNVGKSTLLSKITSSKPEIKNYSFTTKNLNIGYLDKNKTVQIIDTPGSLDRFEKMNYIEKIAFLALKLKADLIIYVIDPTEPYPIEKQKKLLLSLNRLGKKIVVYQSKSDLIGDKKLFNAVIDTEKIKNIIISEAKNHGYLVKTIN